MFGRFPAFLDKDTLYLPGASLNLQSGNWCKSDRIPQSLAQPKAGRWLIPDANRPGGLIILESNPEFRLTWFEADGTLRKELTLGMGCEPSQPTFVDGWVFYNGVVISPNEEVFHSPNLSLTNFLSELKVDYPEMPELLENPRRAVFRASLEILFTDGKTTIWMERMKHDDGYEVFIARGRECVAWFSYHENPTFHLAPNGFWLAEDRSLIQLVWGYRDQILGTCELEEIGLCRVYEMVLITTETEWVLAAHGLSHDDDCHSDGSVSVFRNGKLAKSFPGIVLTSNWIDVEGFRFMKAYVPWVPHQFHHRHERGSWMLTALPPVCIPRPINATCGLIGGVVRFGAQACVWVDYDLTSHLLFQNGDAFVGRKAVANKRGVLLMSLDGKRLFFFPHDKPGQVQKIRMPEGMIAEMIWARDEEFTIAIENADKHCALREVGGKWMVV